jgi:hypothetical protein
MDTRARLVEAREKLDSKDLAGAMALYDEVLAEGCEGAEELATMSGDLGATGHIPELIDILAPIYDPNRHGPAAGLNLLQAYLAQGDPDAARHVLDLLVALERPELEERLLGFEGAVAKMTAERVGDFTAPRPPVVRGSMEPPPSAARASLVSISKPIWLYGIEALSGEILPAKAGRVRRIAFCQLSLGEIYDDPAQAGRAPEDALGRFARAFPMWLNETFNFSPIYSSFAAIPMVKEADGASFPLLPDHEWTADNLHQLVSTTAEGLDYVVTGHLTLLEDGSHLVLRVWDAKKIRERKQFASTWTPATADEALSKLHREVCRFMECVPSRSQGGFSYAPPASPTAWLDVLGSSVGLFLAGKDVFAKGVLAPLGPTCAAFAPRAADSALASLAWITLMARARALGLAPDMDDPVLAADPIVERAKDLVAI